MNCKLTIEREYKALITERQYTNLLAYYSDPTEITQINFYYFDERNFYYTSGWTIRIRTYLDKLTLQIKLPQKCTEDFHEKMEYEMSYLEIPGKILSETIEKITGIGNLPNAILKGFLITQRATLIETSNYILYLDKNIYLNKVDYEIELELKSDRPIISFLLDSLKQEGITFSKNSLGKNKRFAKQLFKKTE